MTATTDDLSAPSVVVEFADRPGLREVGLTDSDAATRSVQALRKAMSVIHTVTQDMHEAVKKMVEHPNQVEIAFGVKFDTEIGAFVAKAGLEAAITVTLTWDCGKNP